MAAFSSRALRGGDWLLLLSLLAASVGVDYSDALDTVQVEAFVRAELTLLVTWACTELDVVTVATEADHVLNLVASISSIGFFGSGRVTGEGMPPGARVDRVTADRAAVLAGGVAGDLLAPFAAALLYLSLGDGVPSRRTGPSGSHLAQSSRQLSSQARCSALQFRRLWSTLSR